MKGRAAILFSAFFAFSVQAQLNITNHFFLTTYSDSFGVGSFGQRQNFVIMSFYAQMHPQFVISPRDRSTAGRDNFDALTNRIPRYGMQDWGAALGGTNVYSLMYVSGNHATGDAVTDSNIIRNDFLQIIQAPTNAYNRLAIFTNDWSQPNPDKKFFQVFIGDIAYRGLVPNPESRDYSYGARTVATGSGVTFVDSYRNLSNAVRTAYILDQNAYWFNSPALDHPANEIQFVWAITTINSIGEETNIFTAIVDWNSPSTPSTNHCTFTGGAVTGTTLSGTFLADRMGASYYYTRPDQTNDMLGGFALMPSLTNYECEIFRLNNAPAGYYNFYEDGVLIGTFSSAQLAAGINFFTDVHAGAMWLQKKQTLNLLCDYANVSRTNASVMFQPNGNQLWFAQGSDAATVWPTNSISVDSYIGQSDMVADNTALFAEDQVLHANVQQTNHTFSIVLITPRFAPYHR